MIRSLRHALHRWQTPQRYRQLDELLRTQRLSRAEVLAKQQRDLADIVAFAATHTDYYAAAFGPDVARNPPAIATLPILSKQDVIDHLDGLRVRGSDRTQVGIGHTGGSTGKPLAFWYDEAKHELMRAGMMRSYMGSGWRPGEKILNFWGARQDTAAGGVFGSGIGDIIAAERTIPAHEYSEVKLAEWATFIRRYRPVLLQGYASILAELARHVVARGIAMPPTLRGIYSTAEVLLPQQRELMEEAFGCKVFNQYGSREVPNMACECRHGHMHVFTDMVYLESVEAAGEEKLLVTSLTNRLMPFIRYDIGDSGQLLEEECDCGWPFPLMAIGVCRHNDHIRTSTGKRVHPSWFNRLLYGMTDIRQYQWRQESLDSIRLSVVSPPLAAEVVRRLEEAIRRDVDAGMRLEVAYVDEIPRTVSGKHRFVISQLG